MTCVSQTQNTNEVGEFLFEGVTSVDTKGFYSLLRYIRYLIR